MSTIKANTLLHSDGSTTTQPSIPALDTRMAKAWINFYAIGAQSIRGSYNVSSLTDDGVGDHVINFTTAMPNANYSVTGSGSGDSFGTADTCFGPYEFGTGLVKMGVYHSGSQQVDRDIVCVHVFGS